MKLTIQKSSDFTCRTMLIGGWPLTLMTSGSLVGDCTVGVGAVTTISMSSKAKESFVGGGGGHCGGHGVLGGLICGGAHELSGLSIESSVSLSLSGSQMIEGKRPTCPLWSPLFTMPFHQPSSTPLGIRFKILILSPA